MVNEANPNAYNSRVRTWGPPGGSGGRRVVATAQQPTPTASYAGPSSGYNVQQNIRAAEANPAPYVSGKDLAAQQEQQAQLIASQVLGTEMGTGGMAYTTPMQQALQLLGGGGGSGSSSSGGMKASDILANKKWQYEKEQDAAAAEAKQRALQGMINQITSGSYRGNIDDLLGQIGQMETTGKQNIGNIYSNAMSNIGAGYNTAQGLMDTGYTNLENYLSQNPNNPYAGLSAANIAVTNPMQDYLNAYGAMSPDVAGQVQAEQLAGQQGAGAFQSLIDVLSANAKRGDLSRLAEAKMARTMGTSGLGAQRAAYESQAASAQQQALASLAQQIAQAKFEQEQAAGNRYQSIVDAIIAAGGSIPQVSTNPANVAQTLPDFNNPSQDVLDELAQIKIGY